VTPLAEPAVALEVRGEALWATINRPHTRNAIDLDVLAGLESMIAAAGSADVKALLLRGAGGSFCSGADLRQGSKVSSSCSLHT
jgi:enoyl-CoA hydratase/carnithine racemase